jgi:hypothetical protein
MDLRVFNRLPKRDIDGLRWKRVMLTKLEGRRLAPVSIVTNIPSFHELWHYYNTNPSRKCTIIERCAKQLPSI